MQQNFHSSNPDGSLTLHDKNSWSLRSLYIEANPGWLEIPLARSNFHDLKPVRATELLLYLQTFALQIWSSDEVYTTLTLKVLKAKIVDFAYSQDQDERTLFA